MANSTKAGIALRHSRAQSGTGLTRASALAAFVALALLAVSCTNGTTSGPTPGFPPPGPTPASSVAGTLAAPTGPSPTQVSTASMESSATPVVAQSPTSACSNGIAVQDPGQNPSLVHDCNTLLALRDELATSPELDCDELLRVRNILAVSNRELNCVAYRDVWKEIVAEGRLDWNSNTSIVEWQGVNTGGSPARVWDLVLGRLAMTGRIPKELALLTELRTLDLGGNLLMGEIPPELGRLTKLQTLVLGANLLSGGYRLKSPTRTGCGPSCSAITG